MALARVKVALANLHVAPAADARLGSQLLFGEMVEAEGMENGWAEVRALADGYKGYVQTENLARDTINATHRVAVPATFLYPSASIKDQPALPLYLNSLVAVGAITGELAELATGGFVYAEHLKALDWVAPDIVAVAEQFLGVPYLWGGRSFAGIDCSGLVQMARFAAGKPSPRDSSQQEAAGDMLPRSLLDGPTERGLLIFWPGHVAITLDETRIIHASGHVMKVIVEDREQAIARIAARGSSVSNVQRI